MDSSDPRTQPPPQQRQPHLTQTNPQQPPPPQQQQQQQLHQHQQNMHPPQHAQQNQPAGYAPQQQQQHGYQHPQMQFPQYPQAHYRHAYPPQFAQHHITHQAPYQAYAFSGHINYAPQAPWVPPASSFPAAPVSTPTTQGAPVAPKTVPLLKPREKKVLAIVDPKTNKVINESDIKPTNESKNDTNNKTKLATTVAPATNTKPTSTTAKSAPTAAAVATTNTTTTQQSVATTTPTPAATKNSATPVKANNTPSSKPAPVAIDRAGTSSPPSVSNILLQKVSEDSGSAKRPTVTATVTASPIKPKDTAVASNPKVESPKPEAKEEEAPLSSKIVTKSPNNIPPKAESDDKVDVKKDVVDNVKQEEAVTDDKKDIIKDEKDVEADSTKEVAEADGEITLHYEPGQYNPTSNRTGKKKYSREFMVEVCEKICKLNIFNEGANDNNMSGSYPQLDVKIDMFAPKYQQQQNFPNRSNDPSRRQIPNNYMGRSSAGQERARKIIAPSSSLTNEVELKTVSNPWRPGMDKKEDEPLDAVEVEKLKKKFRSILNKLTPNNFDNLATAVTDLHIDTEQKLGEVIDIVFAKALAEPGYCVLYGRMCSHLKKITAGTANFGTTLLQRCQLQFQSDIYAGVNVDERKKKIEEEESPEVKKQLGEELYEEMYRCRMRGLGLIKFIGELYKIEMLNDSIMFSCIERLLNDTSSEESLECLCDLLSTIGEKLDRSSQRKAKDEKKSQKNVPKQPAYATGGKSAASVVASNAPQKTPEPQTLDPIFTQLHTIRKNQELPLSLRIRFKILDVCELREKENWQSKNTKDNNPKKIEEIRKAHEEKLESERQKQAMSGRRSQEGRRLGPAGGSSNQISSLGNDSGARGGMHGSASSQAIRDQNYGDNRQQTNFTDSHKRAEQYQQDKQNILASSKMFLSNLISQTDKTNKADSGALRPSGTLWPSFKTPKAPATNANSNNSSASNNSTANTNRANAPAGSTQ